MYGFVLATASTPIAFIYILPLILVLTLTHDLKLLTIVNSAVLLMNFIQAGYNLIFLGRTSEELYITEVEIQIAVTVLFNIFSFLSSRVDVAINSQKIGKIKE